MLAPAPALTAFVVARDCRFQRGDEEGGGGCAPTSAAKGAQGIKKMEMERAAAPIGWVIGCRFFFNLPYHFFNGKSWSYPGRNS